MANGPTETSRETEKRSVSAPADLLAEADKIMARRRITNFSEYVRDLIRRDLETKEKEEQVAA